MAKGTLSILFTLGAAALACSSNDGSATEIGSPPPDAGGDAGVGGSDSGGTTDGGGDGGIEGGSEPEAGGPDSGSDGPGGPGGNPAFVLSAYKDTSINMNFNTNVITTKFAGNAAALTDDMKAHGATAITLAFATGECGSENWAGVPGAQLATANMNLLVQAGAKYILSTGGAAGTFTCASDAGMSAFVDRWASPNLLGVDFDIESGQSQATLDALAQRIVAAHGKYPALRFSLTLATLAAGKAGSSQAVSRCRRSSGRVTIAESCSGRRHDDRWNDAAFQGLCRPFAAQSHRSRPRYRGAQKSGRQLVLTGD
jgi:hypothetical protein